MGIDANHVPNPIIQPHEAVEFNLSAEQNIKFNLHNFRLIWELTMCHFRHIQLLEGGQCLLVLHDTLQNRLVVYLEELSNLDAGIAHNNARRIIHCDKLGQEINLVYDECKRTLAVCGTDFSKV